jgi:hypothetical protein
MNAWPFICRALLILFFAILTCSPSPSLRPPARSDLMINSVPPFQTSVFTLRLSYYPSLSRTVKP